MPGFSESIGTHKVHPVNMALSFFCSGTTNLDNTDVEYYATHAMVKVRTQHWFTSDKESR